MHVVWQNLALYSVNVLLKISQLENALIFNANVAQNQCHKKNQSYAVAAAATGSGKI